jgi:arylformamidase
MSSGYDLNPDTPAARALQATYKRQSDSAARLPGAQLDLAYGPHPRQKLDVFSAGSNAPVILFFHGGYWTAGSKDTRRFPSPTWIEHGVSWVAINYRLTPENALKVCVADARAATNWIAGNAATLGLNRNALHVAGNSAGGHLAAMVSAENWHGRPTIRSLTAISGLFDLSPLIRTVAQDWLRLTSQSATALSPIVQLPPPGLPVLIGWGGLETQVFADQSNLYAKLCRKAGIPTQVFTSSGVDHFKIIGEFGEPGTQLFDMLLQQVLAVENLRKPQKI